MSIRPALAGGYLSDCQLASGISEPALAPVIYGSQGRTRLGVAPQGGEDGSPRADMKII